MKKVKSGVVAICGRPNAGKSTLLNHVLGAELSIVSPKAQTTRDRIHGILHSNRGQIVFVDTPGIHQAKPGGINEYMVKEAGRALEEPDLIWYLVDPETELHHEKAVIRLLNRSNAPVAIMLNKVDAITKRQFQNGMKLLEEITHHLKEQRIEVLWSGKISARKGTCVPELMELTWRTLKEGEPLFPETESLSDRPMRFFVSEKIREQLFLQLGDEIPYACAVSVDKFDESVKPTRIEATIHVERDSQKGMVVGKGGSKIKDIGKAARLEIEDLMGEHIFLGLKVNLHRDWSKKQDALKLFGYHAQ